MTQQTHQNGSYGHNGSTDSQSNTRPQASNHPGGQRAGESKEQHHGSSAYHYLTPRPPHILNHKWIEHRRAVEGKANWNGINNPEEKYQPPPIEALCFRLSRQNNNPFPASNRCPKHEPPIIPPESIF